MKAFAAPRACRGWKAKRCIGMIFFRTFVLSITLMLSRIFSEPLMSVSNKHNYKTFSESPPAFPPYFLLISWRGKRPFLINGTRTFAWKEPLPIAPPLPLGKLDNLSSRVGDFAQKIIPDLSYPEGDPRGYTWYFHYLWCCSEVGSQPKGLREPLRIAVGASYSKWICRRAYCLVIPVI